MARNLLFKYFPPPAFLRMPIAGMDISDDSVHIVELGETRAGKVVKKFVTKPIPAGLIEDGRIQDVEKVKVFFYELKREFGLEFVAVSLPEQHGYVVAMRIPKMLPDEIYGSLELQIEEHVPLSASEAVFGYDIVKTSNDVAFIELNVTVYPRTIVEQYASVFSETGITPLRFEIEAHAVSRAVIPKGDNGTFMILDFGKTRTGLTIVTEGSVRFTTTVGVGGDTITRAIAKNLDISFEEAEKMKREKGFLIGDGDQKILRALMPAISALKDEIGKHYQYWNTHTDQFGKKRPKIDMVVLCGGLANLAGLPEYLSPGLRVAVHQANVFVNVNSFDVYIPKLPFSESLQYATSIGLALSSNR